MSTGFKVLTVHQPWARLLTIGEKLIENRDWHTPYRGTLLIHASRNSSLLQPKYSTQQKRWIDARSHLPTDDMPHGKIVGAVELLDTCELTLLKAHANWWRLRDHQHAVGRVCWIVGRPRAFAQPIDLRGQQGLFNLPTELITAVQEQLHAAAVRYQSTFESHDDDATCSNCGHVTPIDRACREYHCLGCYRVLHTDKWGRFVEDYLHQRAA